MNVLNKPIVLSCNKFWKALKPTTPEKAFVDMAKDTVRAIHIEYSQNPDGSFNFDKPIMMEPVNWEKWLTLEPRPFDFVIHTPRLTIRVPTVVICVDYAKTPMARKRLTTKGVLERDGYRCQYTNVPLTRRTGTVDHVVARSRGGKTIWTNLVAAHRDVNLKKGNKLNSEAGLKLLRQPKEPPLMPVCANIKNVAHKDWEFFLFK